MSRRAMVRRSAVAIAIASSLAAPAPLGAWTYIAPANSPVCTASGPQTYPACSPAEGGEFLVAWNDHRSSTQQVYIQRLGATGLPKWTGDGVAIAPSSAYQLYPVPLSDGEGGAFVVWRQGYPNGDLHAQRFDALGNPLWGAIGVPVCAAPGDIYGQIVQPDGTGGIIVAWQDARETPSLVYAQRLNRNGLPLWATDGVRVCSDPGGQNSPAVFPDGAGGAFVAWFDTRGGSSIYAQWLDPGGSPHWAADGALVSSGPDLRQRPMIVGDGAGGLLVVWDDRRDNATNGYDVYAQRLDALGRRQWGAGGRAVAASSVSEHAGGLVQDGAGGLVVGWYAAGDPFGDPSYEVRAQRLSPEGAELWASGGLLVFTGTVNSGVELVSDQTGGAILAWAQGHSDDNDIFAQRVDASGSAMWAPGGVAMTTAAGDQYLPVLAAAEPGGAVAFWCDGRGGLGNEDVFAQHVAPDGKLDDAFEQNDACAEAWPQGSIVHLGLVVHETDADWYAITVPRSVQLRVWLTFTHSEGDIDIELYDECGALLAFSAGANDYEVLTYLNTGPTRQLDLRVFLYCCGASNHYDMSLDLAGTANIVADWTPSGWAAPVVPRNAGGATPAWAPVTPTLDGNAQTTRLNMALRTEGPNHLPAWSSITSLDGEPAWFLFVGDDVAPADHQPTDLGLLVVRGGRHELWSNADPGQEVPETAEGDNQWRGQWVWSPLELGYESPVVRLAPPMSGLELWAQPNADGMRFERRTGYAWVTSLAPRSLGVDDYDLWLYDDYSGSESGFSNLMMVSSLLSNATDFVVGHYFGTPLALYPAAVRFFSDGAEYVADASDALGRDGNLVANALVEWRGHVLGPNRLANVYEAYLEATHPCFFTLRPIGGAPGLRFAIFSGADGGVYPREFGVPSWPVGDLETVNYVPGVTGWHPIVVFRDTGAETEVPLFYDFLWSSTGPVSVSGGATPTELALAAARPNPMRGGGAFEISLPAAARVTLSILDVQGRRVRTLAESALEPGWHTLPWDGRGDDGARLGAGIYWARFEAMGRVMTRRVALLW